MWVAISLLGAGSLAAIAFSNGEKVNAVFLIVAAVSTFAVAYRFYSKFIAEKVFALSNENVTPAITMDDGKDYVPTNKYVLFGHHFAAIAGAGPLVGPILAASVRLFARHYLAHRRSRSGWCGAGLRNFVRV